MTWPDLGPWISAWFADETGRRIVEYILVLARWLTGEAPPGWVSLGLLIALGALSLAYGFISWRFVRAVNAARDTIRGGPGGKITGNRLIDIERAFAGQRGRRGYSSRLATAWSEFKETALQPSAGPGVLRNTVRPAAFFNREDLSLEAGIWRQVPAYFVSVGLLLTFLGLIAALDQTGDVLGSPSTGTGTTVVAGLRELLQVASAKFIMSLTGLFCSIVFSLVLRFLAKWKDRALHALCKVIEDGCDYLSEQDVLRQLLDQTEEQTTHLQTFGTELVAQIARPLKEELPNAIRESLAAAMQPVIDNISRGTHRGIDALAGRVSDQLVDGVQSSVVAMNATIEGIRGALEAVTHRLDQSSGAMSENVGKAVESLGSQIETLKAAMAASAEASGREIERAGREMASGIGAATQEMRATVLDPMNELGAKVERLASGVDAAAGRLEGYAQSVELGARAVATANEALERSVGTIVVATEPVQAAVGGIETATRAMGDRVEAAAEAMARTTTHTESVLRGAREAIEASHVSVQEGLGTLEQAVTEFRQVIDSYREIDRSLGDAFARIEAAVRGSIDEIGTFQRKVNEEFGRALHQLEAVIAQAEPFTPAGQDE